MRILIVCGAGASSTFVAKRLQRAADAADVDLSARPGTWGSISAHADVADLVLLGPHLADHLDEVRQNLTPTPVALLPEGCIRDLTGRDTLAFVLETSDPDASPALEGRS
ncbi:PTS sugar transporter subunit IIB [Microbacterium gorillae]|uniref:PTS sugar transporter subunit IIB n=1 Tax=Microbacterium gorillae TaxID=1231063 RepID=UPI0005904AB3|nr:hypothetical protein [Microbacterium gorillae]